MNEDAASLDHLHDIVVPASAPWWPPAPAWDWLLAFAAVAILWAALAWFIRRQRDAYRREALTEWKRIDVLLAEPRHRVTALADLATLLKRVALTVYPRADVAPLTGEAWRAFLNRTGGSSGFTSPAGERLERAAYGGATEADLANVAAKESADLVHDWLIRHRVEPGEMETSGKAAR